MSDARGIALEVLRDIERRRGFSNRILDEHLARHPGLDPRDRGLVTTLVYGVLRHRARLDLHVDAVADSPKKIKGELRELLRMAAYELRELDRAAGIVGQQATKMARRLDKRRGLDGLVTAIVRGIDEHGAALDEESASEKPLDVLANRYSIPRWLAGRWIKTLGPQIAVARAQAVAEPPSVDLRVDLHRTDRDTVAARLGERPSPPELELPHDHPQCIRTRGGADLFRDPMHAEGLFSIQGLGSQQAAKLLAPAAGERVLDACAGMGGKTLHLAELMERAGTIVAVDTDPRRLAQLEKLRARGDLDRSGFELSIIEADVTDPNLDLDAPFDAILVDAPCTGLGNLARHPELRWTTQFEDIATCAERQRTILRGALGRVAPQGRLVYAVCSLEPEEGPAVVAKIASESKLDVVTEQSWSPEEHLSDGFYLALLQAG